MVLITFFIYPCWLLFREIFDKIFDIVIFFFFSKLPKTVTKTFIRQGTKLLSLMKQFYNIFSAILDPIFKFLNFEFNFVIRYSQKSE